MPRWCICVPKIFLYYIPDLFSSSLKTYVFLYLDPQLLRRSLGGKRSCLKFSYSKIRRHPPLMNRHQKPYKVLKLGN